MPAVPAGNGAGQGRGALAALGVSGLVGRPDSDRVPSRRRIPQERPLGPHPGRRHPGEARPASTRHRRLAASTAWILRSPAKATPKTGVAPAGISSSPGWSTIEFVLTEATSDQPRVSQSPRKSLPDELDALDPLGHLLPVQARHQDPQGVAVLDRQRLAVDLDWPGAHPGWVIHSIVDARLVTVRRREFGLNSLRQNPGLLPEEPRLESAPDRGADQPAARPGCRCTPVFAAVSILG